MGSRFRGLACAVEGISLGGWGEGVEVGPDREDVQHLEDRRAAPTVVAVEVGACSLPEGVGGLCSMSFSVVFWILSTSTCQQIHLRKSVDKLLLGQ